MFKSIIKKALVGSALTALVGTFVFGRDAVSYFRTGYNNVREVVKSEVPLEFEINRAKTLVDQLIPDIRQCMQVIAEQEVDVEYRQAALAQQESALMKQKDAILAMRTDLTSAKSVLVYAGQQYSNEDVKRDLANRFDRYKSTEEMLAANRTILQARKQTLVANTGKLNGLHQAKRDLEVKLEQLQARVQTIRAAETVSQLAIDDSNLSHARKLITDLNKQLDVKQKMLDTEVKFADLIPIEKTTPAVALDLDKQIDAYFGIPTETARVAKTE